MRTISMELREDGDCQIDVYDERALDLERWFCSADDIAHIIGLIREEIGESAYIIPNYF